MYDSIWSKSVWIAFWTLQLVSTAIFLALSAAALILWKDYSDDYGYGVGSSYKISSGEVDSAINVVYGVFIGLSGLTIILNIVEIILFVRKRLSPVATVVFNSVTTAIWLGVFVLLALAAVGGKTSVFSWIVIITAFAASIGKLAYGSVILHRNLRRFAHRKGAYTSAPAVVEHEFDSSPNGPYTAHNAGGTAVTPLRNVAPAAYENSSIAADGYYDPESIGRARYA